MSQTVALLVDSSRELRSRFLFWVSLALSAIVAIALFGAIGFNEDGWRVLWFDTNESTLLRAGSARAREMMMGAFSMFVRVWLCWGAIVLAVVSTSSILPGFMAGGAIEVTLAKPISRPRLFLVKVFGALLFVTAQTTISVVLAFVLLGWRGDLWMPTLFWAIPLIAVQFLYLYAVSALVAVVTRSTVASLLFTCVFWAMVSMVQFASNTMDKAQFLLDTYEAQKEELRDTARREGRELTPFEVIRISGIDAELQPLRGIPYQRLVNTIEDFVPKTADIQKMVADITGAPVLSRMLRNSSAGSEMDEAVVAASEAIQNVDRVKSLSTSLAGTALILGLATVIFTRRGF